MPKQINIKLGFEADVSQAKKQIADLQNSLNSLLTNSVKDSSLSGFNQDVVNAQQSVLKLKTVIDNSLNADTGKLDLSKFNQQLNNSNLNLNKLAQDMNMLGSDGRKAFLNLANSIVTAQKPMLETNKLLDGMWTALKNTARWQLSSSILHGFMGALQGAYGYAQDLNKSLNNIRIVTGQSTEQMAKFAEQANKSAQALSVSTTGYTDAALIYYQQGLDDEEVKQRTDVTMKLSNVTGESAEQVSSYMTAIWNNFKEGSQSLEYYADVITALGAATASSSEEIANGMQQFAAVAETVGLSYDYAATALATVVAQTRQSESTVGNAFRTIFSRLESLSLGDTLEDGTTLTKYSKALETIGVNIKDQNGELKNMDTILDEIGGKWQVLSRDQQIALAQTVGGVRQYANLIALFDNWDTFQKNLQVAQGAEGTLQEQADIYAESWEAAQKRVKAAWQALYQDLLDENFFIGFANSFAKILQVLDKFIDSVGGLPGVLSLVGVAITSVFGNKLTTALENAQLQLSKILKPMGSTLTYAEIDANKIAQETLQATLQDQKKSLGDKNAPENQIIIDNLEKQIQLNGKLSTLKGVITDKEYEELRNLIDITGEYAKQAQELENIRREAELNAISSTRTLRDQLLDSEEEGNKGKIKNILGILGGTNQRFNAGIEEIAKSSDLDQNKMIDALINQHFSYRKELGLSTKAISTFIQDQVKLAKASKESSKALETERKATEKLDNIFEGKTTADRRKRSRWTSALNSAREKKDAKEKELAKKENEIKILESEINDHKDGLKTYSENITQEALSAALERDERKLNKLKTEANNLKKDIEHQEEIITRNETKLNQTPTDIPENSVATEKPFFLQPEFAKNSALAMKGISELTLGITSLSSAINIFEDTESDLTFFEKLQQALPSLMMALPMINSGLDKLPNILNVVQTSVIGLTQAAAQGFTTFMSTLGATLTSLLATIGPILAVVAAVWLVKKAFDAWQASTPEGKLKAASEAAEKASQKLEETSQAYDNLKSSLEEYKNVQDSLKDMEGSERAEAIAEENEKIRELILNIDDWKNKVGEIEYDDSGLIILNDHQKDILQNYYLQEESLARQEATLTKIAELEAKRNKEVSDSNAPKITLSGGGAIAYDPNDPYSDPLGYSTTKTVNSDLYKLFAKNNLFDISDIDERQKDYRDALSKLYDKEQVAEIIEQLKNIANDTSEKGVEILKSFNEQIDAERDTNNSIKLLKDSYYRESLGGDASIAEATSFDLGQKFLVDAFAKLDEDRQKEIAEAIRSGDSLVEAWTEAAQIISAATEAVREDLINKISSANNGLENNKKDVVNWVDNLSEDDLKIVSKLEIEYDDTLEEVQHKFYEALNNNPVEFDTSGLTKKQVQELEEEFANLTDYLYDNAEQIDELDDHLADCRREASQVAKAIIRFDDAIQDVTENYEDWNNALTSGSMQEAAKAAISLQKAYSNLLDLDGINLSSEFLKSTENLQLMKEAIEDNEDSYKKLAAAANEDIIKHLEFAPDDLSKFYSELDNINKLLDKQNFNDLEIGANLDIDNFLESLTNMVNAAHMTEEEATAYLRNMGVDAEVTTIPAETTEVKRSETEWVPGTYHIDSLGSLGGEKAPAGSFGALVRDTEGQWVTKTIPHTEQISPSAFALKVTSAHKSAGGNFKFKNASYGGGGKSAGKSSGGSNGSSSTKKRETKEAPKDESRYHDIKKQIDSLNTAYSRLEKTRNRVFGKSQLKYLEKEIELSKEQTKLTRDYIDEIKNYLSLDMGKLQGIGQGAIFDENGNLTNYEEVLKNINQTYADAIKTYNESAQEDADKELLDAAQKRYEEEKKVLDQYEDTYKLLQDQNDKLIEDLEKEYDKLVEFTKLKVTLQVDFNENDRKLLQFLYDNLGTSADKASDRIANLAQQTGLSQSNIETYKTGISDLLKNHGIDINEVGLNGEDWADRLRQFMAANNLAGELTQEEAEAFKAYAEGLMDNHDQIKQNFEKVHQIVTDAIDEWNEKLSEQSDIYDQLESKLNHYRKIIDLTGRKVLGITAEDINKINTSLVKNAQNQVISNKQIMDTYIKEREEAYQQWQKFLKDGNLAAAEKWEEHYKQLDKLTQEATENYYANWEDALDKINKKFEDSLDLMEEDYKNAFGKGGLDWISEQFERLQDKDTWYLPDYKKYHELNKLTNDLQKSINKTSNSLVKSKMTETLDEINNKLKEGVQISETEAEIYARRVALLQAEAELENAKNAKSAVRMTRDNEGNFSYTYTADQTAIDEAKQKATDAYYEYKDTLVQQANDYQAQLIQLDQDWIETIKRINKEYKDDEDARQEHIDQANQYYQEKRRYLVGQLDIILADEARLRDNDWKHVELLTGKKIDTENSFITTFEETTLAIAGGYESRKQFDDEWLENTKIAYDTANQIAQEWQQDTQQTYYAASSDISTFKDDVNTALGDIDKKSEETKKTINDMIEDPNEGLKHSFNEAFNAAAEFDAEFSNELNNMSTEIGNLVGAIDDMLKAIESIADKTDGAVDALNAQADAARDAANAMNQLNTASGGDGISGGGYTPDDFDNNTKDKGDDQIIDVSYVVMGGGKTGGPFSTTGQAEAFGSMYGGNLWKIIKYRSGRVERIIVKSFGRLKYSGGGSSYNPNSGNFKNDVASAASGMYTGNWHSSEGRLAMLHEKELVLNKEDTVNMLKAVDLVRKISENTHLKLQSNFAAEFYQNRLNNLNNTADTLEQQVHIEAVFPNAVDHNEIELAFNDLINSATQFVNRK